MAAPRRGPGEAEGPKGRARRLYEVPGTGGRIEDRRRDPQEAGKAEVGTAAPSAVRKTAEGLFPASQNCGHHAGAAASVDHGDNPQRFLVRRVGNEIAPRLREA